jgi:aryl sulfotransferase
MWIRNEKHIGPTFFEGGAGRFFHKGTNGRGRDVLTEEDLALYETAARRLDRELRTWLEAGAAPTLDSGT